MADQQGSGGMGCLEVAIVVLIVLWFTGYFDTPKPPAVTPPVAVEEDK